MREILFRGKSTEHEGWVTGFYVYLVSDKKESHRIYTGYAERDVDDLYPDWYEVDPATVGQYTGLKDENGQKIFDGDILQYQPREIDYWRDHNKWYCVVMFGDFNCSCCDGVYGWYLKGGDIRDFCSDDLSGPYLVVGNIYDTPEFMEGA